MTTDVIASQDEEKRMQTQQKEVQASFKYNRKMFYYRKYFSFLPFSIYQAMLLKVRESQPSQFRKRVHRDAHQSENRRNYSFLSTPVTATCRIIYGLLNVSINSHHIRLPQKTALDLTWSIIIGDLNVHPIILSLPKWLMIGNFFDQHNTEPSSAISSSFTHRFIPISPDNCIGSDHFFFLYSTFLWSPFFCFLFHLLLLMFSSDDRSVLFFIPLFVTIKRCDDDDQNE